MSDFYESEFCLFLAIVLLDSLDEIPLDEHHLVHREINYLCDMLHDYDLGYFECVLDLVSIVHTH